VSVAVHSSLSAQWSVLIIYWFDWLCYHCMGPLAIHCFGGVCRFLRVVSYTYQCWHISYTTHACAIVYSFPFSPRSIRYSSASNDVAPSLTLPFFASMRVAVLLALVACFAVAVSAMPTRSASIDAGAAPSETG
jgi:hypothetical protein